jgi:hypothetical protein
MFIDDSLARTWTESSVVAWFENYTVDGVILRALAPKDPARIATSAAKMHIRSTRAASQTQHEAGNGVFNDPLPNRRSCLSLNPLHRGRIMAIWCL